MSDEPRNWMVIRPASFAPYWARPATFGPMTEDKARAMVNSQYGGHMVTVSKFTAQGYV